LHFYLVGTVYGATPQHGAALRHRPDLYFSKPLKLNHQHQQQQPEVKFDNASHLPTTLTDDEKSNQD
jgi:hypothetical protein